MGLVAALAGRVARLAMVGPAMARIKRKVVRTLVGGLLLVSLGMIGVIYLLAALRVELERHLGPLWSPLIIGTVFCLFAGISYWMFLRPRRSDARIAEAVEKKVVSKFVRPAQRVEDEIARRPWLSVGASLGTGFAAAFLLQLLRGRKRREATMLSRSETIDQPWERQIVVRQTEPRKTNSGFADTRRR